MSHSLRVRALDNNGDIIMSGGAWLYDIDAVAQTIKTRLNLYSREYWRDVSEGTPWIKKILGKNNVANTLTQKERLLKDRILGAEGVISITSWESSFDFPTRKLSITANILTRFGIITITDGLSTNSEDTAAAAASVLNLQLAVHNWITSAIYLTNTVT